MQVEADLRRIHTWLRKVEVCALPGPRTPLLEGTIQGLLGTFDALGHRVVDRPGESTDILLATAPFGEPLDWREAPMLTARKRFGLERTPWVFTLVPVSPQALQHTLEQLSLALARERPDPAQYAFPGLAQQAYQVLHEQGRRGGSMLALARLVQAQAKSIRVLLVVGERQVREIYHFDLVGGHPASRGPDLQALFANAALRVVTTVSTRELTAHMWVADTLPQETWRRLETPKAMPRAARALRRRRFFTRMVRVKDLVRVPVVGDAIANQYSEGCFATWDVELGALITTVTGSARPVEKGSITERDLTLVVGTRPDGQGALVRPIEGHPRDPPSSEAVEMMMLVQASTPVLIPGGRQAPAIRSILHGHRGVASYDPDVVEFVPLDAPYYHFPVTCATEAQAQGLLAAFSRSEALKDPQDPRCAVFTVLPTHGAAIIEKWVPGKAPFEHLCQLMDNGQLEIEEPVPQGPLRYIPAGEGRMQLVEDETPEGESIGY